MSFLRNLGKIIQAAMLGDAIVTIRKHTYEEVLETSRYDEDEAMPLLVKLLK